MEKTEEINGIVFTNLIDTLEKETALKSTYTPNKGKVYDLTGALKDEDKFFEKNRDNIYAALSLLQGESACQ